MANTTYNTQQTHLKILRVKTRVFVLAQVHHLMNFCYRILPAAPPQEQDRDEVAQIVVVEGDGESTKSQLTCRICRVQSRAYTQTQTQTHVCSTHILEHKSDTYMLSV